MRNRRGFAVNFVDVDGFKVINDTLGHGIGDHILQELAIRLKDIVGSSGIVARFGGDEFVVVVDDIADASMAAANAERLTRCFMDDFHLPGARMNISASVGISLFPEHGTTMSELLSHADAAMYAAKAFGGSSYRFFEASMDVDAIRKMEIRRDLQVAPECGQMFVVYQPKFDCKTGQVVGAEALLRWRHPRFGMVSPAEFIPIAEQSGQIGRIGKWVMAQVCESIAEWAAAGTPMVPIAVNLSLVQLHSATLVDDILNLTNLHGVTSRMVMFEITESVAMRNAQETVRSLDRLRQAGFELAIDGFGTGYSSLSHLQQFSVSQIKVDRMFVKDLSETNIKGRSMVAAIIGLAHSMGMVVVAEGVETQSQAVILREMSCDQFQGFLFARPLPLEDFVALLTDDKALAA